MNIDLPINQLRTSSSNLSSLSFTSNLNLPDSANHSAASFKPTRSASCCCCGSKTCRKLELANGKDARASGFSYNSVFGPVPSQSEVQTAASFLQKWVITFGNRLFFISLCINFSFCILDTDCNQDKKAIDENME